MIPLRANIAAMKGYVPGFQPADEQAFIKLNTNENPYPPSPEVVRAILAELGADGERLRKYPSASSQKLREAAGELYGFDPSWIVMANGSDEVLNNLIRAFAGEGEEIGYIHPSYSYYATLAEIQGARVRTFGLTPDFRIADFPESYTTGSSSSSPPPTPPSALPFPSIISSNWPAGCRGCWWWTRRTPISPGRTPWNWCANLTTWWLPGPCPRAIPWRGCGSASPSPARK